ncbi:MAG: efflux RND transporter periplasmic adaptor subunit, partial [Phascolarctobacterium sp.]
TEYLKLKGTNNSLENLEAVLADGTTYPLKGKVAEVNRGISDGTGTLTIRAIYQNPERQLLPGMFAHVRAIGGTKEGALLIPQRAITELMYKKFVYVIGNDNKVAMKEVTLGQNVGRLVVVESGLDGSENLVVEGTSKMSNGVTVKAEPMTEADLDTAEKTEQKK